MPDAPATMQLTEEETVLAQQFAEARNNRSAWEKIEKQLRDKLLAALEAEQADAALTASGAPAFHRSVSQRTTVDSARLEALYPQVYEDVVKVTTVTKVDIDLEG